MAKYHATYWSKIEKIDLGIFLGGLNVKTHVFVLSGVFLGFFLILAKQCVILDVGIPPEP